MRVSLWLRLLLLVQLASLLGCSDDDNANGSDADMDMDTDSDADTDTDTDSDTDTDTGPSLDDKYQWHTFLGDGVGYIPGDAGFSVSKDQSGNIIVAGVSGFWKGPNGEAPLNPHTVNSGLFDIFVVKLSSEGIYEWHTFYGAQEYEYVQSVSSDESGNIFVTGSSQNSWEGSSGEAPLNGYFDDGVSESFDLFLLKLNSQGEYVWHTFHGANDDDAGSSLAVDDAGNAIVTGYSRFSWDGPGGESPLNEHFGLSSDLYVLKLNSQGEYQWHTFYGGEGDEGASAMTIDGSGSIFVTGSSSRTWTGPENENPLDPHPYESVSAVFVLELDSSGSYQWHTFHGGEQAGIAYGIALDDTGNILTTGYSLGTWKGPSDENPINDHMGVKQPDIFALKLNSEGIYQWHTFHGNLDDSYGDIAYSLGTNSLGNIFVTGHSYKPWNGPMDQSPLNPHSGKTDIFVLGLDQDGLYRWHAFYGIFTGFNRHDLSRSLFVDDEDNMFLTGNSFHTWDGPSGQSPLIPHSDTSNNSETSNILVMKLSD